MRAFPVLVSSFCRLTCRYDLVEALQYSGTSIFVDSDGKSTSTRRLAGFYVAHRAFNFFHSESRVEVLFYIC